MATERDQPWWADAQEYRHRDTRRRNADDARIPRGDEERGADVARRRRAAAARAAAQQRRSRQDRPTSRTRRAEPTEFPWIDESPFAPRGADDRPARGRHDERSGDRAPARPGRSVARRPGRAPARRRAAGPLARPEKLLLYIAILGLFLVLAAATNSDAATLLPAASDLAR